MFFSAVAAAEQEIRRRRRRPIFLAQNCTKIRLYAFLRLSFSANRILFRRLNQVKKFRLSRIFFPAAAASRKKFAAAMAAA